MEQELLQKLLVYIENTENFLVEQTPLYVQELLHYNSFESGLHTCIGIIVCVILLACILVDMFNLIHDRNNLSGLVTIFGTAFLVFLTIFTMQSYTQYYKINNTPKVFLIEKVKELSK